MTAKELPVDEERHTFLGSSKEKALKTCDRDSFAIDSESSDSDAGRELWPRKIEYFLSVIGFVIGYGSIWRFPYMCARNGGGAFLIPYVFFLVTLGLPLFSLEVSMGQFSGQRVVEMWAVCPLFKGIGVAMLTVSGIISVYYNVIVSWVLYYLSHSFYPTLPWTTCTNPWNTKNCVTSQYDNLNALNKTVMNATVGLLNANASFAEVHTLGNYTANSSAAHPMSAAEEFWSYQVLDISSGIEETGGIRWQLALCLLGAWLITYFCCIKGIKSAGKIVYVTAVAPYILLLVFLIRALMQPGSVDGILYFLTPKFEHLLKVQVWIDACLQMFYSLGPAWGALITMSSYNKFRNNAHRDACIIVCINGSTMILSGLVVFSIMGFMAHEAGVSVEEVVGSGPGLVFVAYPEAISRLPLPQLWAVLFFLMLLAVGLDSQFGTFETVNGAIVDIFPKKWKFLITTLLALVSFLMGLLFVTRAGVYWFQIIDFYSVSYTVLLIALVESLVFSWIYGIGQVSRDIEMMMGRKPWKPMCISWCFVAPVIMAGCFCISMIGSTPPQYGDYHYPDWAIGIGWTIAVMGMLVIPVVGVWKVVQVEGTLGQRLRMLIVPDSTWGPASKPFKEMYKYDNYRNAPSVLERIKKNILHS